MKSRFCLALGLCLSLFLNLTPALAQGGPMAPTCEQCWTLQDPTCEGTACPTAYTGAVTLDFTAPCTDTYKFACKIWGCTSGLCSYCAACTKVVEVPNVGPEIFIAECLAIGDDDGNCEGSTCAPAATSISLTQNHNYRLYVRKGNCTEKCGNCNCKVEGRVFHPQAACPSW